MRNTSDLIISAVTKSNTSLDTLVTWVWLRSRRESTGFRKTTE